MAPRACSRKGRSGKHLQATSRNQDADDPNLFRNIVHVHGKSLLRSDLIINNTAYKQHLNVGLIVIRRVLNGIEPRKWAS
ncbi:hypothetical protein SBDP2_650001 [Syntrophobacter sp. SbD2]|nr:hypothetical protein SBDP2_650001 [Syntrophobacter sp. SbD2]